MGLNYVRRGRRMELDSPNDFITVALGQKDIRFAAQDEHLIYKFQDDIIEGVFQKVKNLRFD